MLAVTCYLAGCSHRTASVRVRWSGEASARSLRTLVLAVRCKKFHLHKYPLVPVSPAFPMYILCTQVIVNLPIVPISDVASQQDALKRHLTATDACVVSSHIPVDKGRGRSKGYVPLFGSAHTLHAQMLLVSPGNPVIPVPFSAAWVSKQAQGCAG